MAAAPSILNRRGRRTSVAAAAPVRQAGQVEVMLLGTGAADGIPNPFCECATCADYRRRGQLRTPTSILIDARLLVDPGPESPRQVSRLGRDLLGCRVILAGHAHSDHLDPSVLMHRSWVTDAGLDVLGPDPVIAASRQWLDPQQEAVRFVTLTSGDRVNCAGYDIEALSANHDAYGEALCYRIDDGSASLLYLTDTGPLPEQTLAAVTGRRVDLVLLEETFGYATKSGRHHDLPAFTATVAALRANGTVDECTRIVPIHLGHDNPPLAVLTEEMAALGAEVLADGDVITLG